ncbi:hypothetical protein AVEN_171026-1 [Araneus ventricosus]|uniref:Uncharacterized protein n=1 Tax=Araneus ventricosus TaxID=182803 RepID=A0A4Y2TQL9_ARAVE|nr:hypothetical protein AVEN_171026-1 [Araneus ventricosus]
MLRSIIVELCPNSAVFVGQFIGRKRKNTAHKYTNCCHDGKVQLPAFPDAPELLKALLSENSPDAKIIDSDFGNTILPLHSLRWERKLNHHVELGHTVTFYYRVSPLYASDQHKESYRQLYIFDSSVATEKRVSNNQNCLQYVFEKLDFVLKEINPFAQSYLQMRRLVQVHPTTSVKMVFLEDKNLDMRRYNAPTLCTEVASIFV